MKNRLGATAACLSLATACAGTVRPALAPETSWISRSTIYEVFVRDFSPRGNLAGVTRGLDGIRATGADIVWLMPIFPVGLLNHKGTLGSPYSVSDYRAVNPRFGTAEDVRALVRATHSRGMKLILDWVPNHTSWDHVWVRRHPDFYVRDERGLLTVPRDDKGKLTDWTDVAQLDYRNPAMRRAMIDAMRYWLVEFGIDGFRVDVAGFVPDGFWLEAVPELRKAVDRPIMLLAEWGDLKMHQLGFDLSYGWEAYSSLKAVWKGAPASSFVERELKEMDDMPAGGLRLRFTTNHDETAWDQPPVMLFGGSAGARAAFVAMSLLPGRPMLYNGQEVESPQRLGIFEQQAIRWNQPGADRARAFYRQVLRLARTDPAFVSGPLGELRTSAPDDVISYRRGDAVVVVNTRPRSLRVELTGFVVDGSRDLLTNRVQRGSTIDLPAYGAAVLRRASSNTTTSPGRRAPRIGE